MKKCLSLTLCLALLFSLAALLPASAEDTLENPNIRIVYFQSYNGYLNQKAKNPNAYEPSLEAKEAFEQKYGGKVEIIAVPWDQMMQKCIDMQQAGDSPDLILLYETNFHPSVIQGIVQNLDNYVTGADFDYYPVDQDNYKWKGSYYGIPIKPYLKHITFNRTLFDYEGLTAPDEYYRNGEWTYEKFLEVGRALTMDTNGDGELDTYGFSGYGDTIGHIILMNHGRLVNIDQASGTASSGLKNPETIEAIQKISEMVAFPGGMWLTDDTEMFGYFDNNALAMIVGKEIADARELPFDVGMVPYPYGPSGDANDVYTYSQCWAVPTGAKNPEGAVAYVRMINEMQKSVGDNLERERYGTDSEGNYYYDAIYAPGHKLVTVYDKGVSDIFTTLATITNYMSDGLPTSTIVERLDPELTSNIIKTFGQ